MNLKNNAQSPLSEMALEPGFFILRFQNDEVASFQHAQSIGQSYIQFHFCLKGNASFQFNQGSYTMPFQEGQAILLYNPERKLPLEVTVAGNSWVVSVFVTIKKFHSLFSQDAQYISFLDPEKEKQKYYDLVSFSPSVAVVLSQILQPKVHVSLENLFLKGKAYELLSLYFNKNEDPSVARCPFLADAENVEKVRQAKELILAQMTNPPSLEALSTAVGLNQKKLKEGFKELYGDTVYGYLLAHKMSEAQRMLDSKKFNVNEVGLKLGYSNASHFITAFKKRFGTTPKKYLMGLSR